MDGSDLAGAVACASTHGPTPQPGRPEAGSLTSPSERPMCDSRPGGRPSRRCRTGRWAESTVRIAGGAKCASAPRVVCALPYGCNREHPSFDEPCVVRLASQLKIRSRDATASTPPTPIRHRQTVAPQGSRVSPPESEAPPRPPCIGWQVPLDLAPGASPRTLRRPPRRATVGLAPDPLVAGSGVPPWATHAPQLGEVTWRGALGAFGERRAQGGWLGMVVMDGVAVGAGPASAPTPGSWGSPRGLAGTGEDGRAG